MIVLWLLLLLLLAWIVLVAVSASQRYPLVIATWADGVSYRARLLPRYFPWLSDNLTLGSYWFAKNRSKIVANPLYYAPTLRHEMTHTKQYAERGWWWVLTKGGPREQEGRAAEPAEWPSIRIIPQEIG